MRRKLFGLTLGTLTLVLLSGSLIYGDQQRQRRAPWEERSPAIGKTIPEVKIYNEKLQNIPLSSLYKGNYLYLQWGGCT
jgi:hypothetical protein